ncbi:MAG: hypothetical protein KUL77_02295 [Thermomonas sp.]|uniref:hypothetical protein n=1 Tax=Thermomonas sp. TaxID=1971895 RepID=UPI001EB250D5|nr:hypothetical protein [Thermomonas sp.]MBV2208377.1 hypothetical protein [Thermomonas sp.]
MKKPIIVLLSENSDLNFHLIRHVLQHRRIPFLHIDPTVKNRNYDFNLITECDGVRVREEILDLRMSRYNLAGVRAVWNRGAAYSGGERTNSRTSENLVYHESVYAYEYIWWLLRHSEWVNPLLDCRASRNRLIQCKVAASCGMYVPKQIVSTKGIDIAEFSRSGGRHIIKCISQGSPHEVGPHALKTEYFREESARKYSNERLSAPVMLQGYLEKDHELRAVVVGDNVFAAAIDSPKHEATALDSRLWREAGLSYYRVKLNDSESSRLVKINSELGLRYSSMDLVRGRDGLLYFLEANPSGQWSFIEMQTGFSITEKIVNLLAGEK